MNKEINKEIIKKIKKAYIYLSTHKSINFIGLSILQFNTLITELNNDGCIGLAFVNDPDNEISTGNIYINKKYIEKENFEYANLIHVCLHECLHILYRHVYRPKLLNDELFRIACEHVIERDLMEISNESPVTSHLIRPYDNKFQYITRLHKELPLCSSSEAREWLKKEIENGNISYSKTPISISSDESLTDNGKEVQSEKNKIIGESVLIEDKINGEILHHVNNIDVNKLTPDQLSDLAGKIKNISNQISSSIGNESNKLKQIVDKLLEVKLPWDVLLEKSIAKHTVYIPSRRTWVTPNKLYTPYGLIPGFKQSPEDGYGDCLLMIDTSGSISENNLKTFNFVINKCMKYWSNIYVIQHDYEPQKLKDNSYYKIFNKENISEFNNFINKEGYSGRGGTSHESTFKMIEKDFYHNYKRKNKLSIVLSLTDYYSDLSPIFYNLEWPKKFPLVFIITQEGSMPPKSEIYAKNITFIKMENN